MLGSLLLGTSKVDPLKFTEFLNTEGEQGWEVVTMEREIRRMLLFFKREAFLVVMKRLKNENLNRITVEPGKNKAV